MPGRSRRAAPLASASAAFAPAKQNPAIGPARSAVFVGGAPDAVLRITMTEPQSPELAALLEKSLPPEPTHVFRFVREGLRVLELSIDGVDLRRCFSAVEVIDRAGRAPQVRLLLHPCTRVELETKLSESDIALQVTEFPWRNIRIDESEAPKPEPPKRREKLL